MLFNSFAFLIFFPVTAFLYYLLPKKWQVPVLLLASCIFYMAFIPKYILILFFLITLDFFLSQAMQQRVGRDRKIFFVASLLANIGLLFVFKYFNFFNTNLAALADFVHWHYSLAPLKIILPLGLSFHIFQNLAYIIEVYRGRCLPEKNYFHYALYVLFFPQLVAGPIERPNNLLPQFKIHYSFDSHVVTQGLERMLWGFFKKLVLADYLAVAVNHVYGATHDYSGWSLLIATFFFAFQIYCDFSGYTDIALGAAQVFGYRLIENFNRPYSARSIADFWKRWHLSLSSWFRDYVYIPLGGNRVSKSRHYANLFIVFLLSGLWHGANWTFVIWGALHGTYLILETMTARLKQKLLFYSGLAKWPKIIAVLELITTFCLVSLAWVFFRAASLDDAVYIIANTFRGLSNYQDLFISSAWGLSKTTLSFLLLGIVLLEVVEYYQAKKNTFYIFAAQSKLLRYSWYYFLLLTILFFSYSAHEARTFIYFQF